MLRKPGSLEGPGSPYCQEQDNGVCEVNLDDADGNGTKLTKCDDAVGLFVFGLGFDVICFTDITIDFTGLFAGPAILHDTFAVYGDGTGGYFNGPSICDCTITDPKSGKVLGRGRVDFFPNEGTFGGDFFGSGGFRINRAYGELEGLKGSGTFEGFIGQEGEYKAVLRFPKDKKK
jgi:hypothetical protein